MIFTSTGSNPYFSPYPRSAKPLSNTSEFQYKPNNGCRSQLFQSKTKTVLNISAPRLPLVQNCSKKIVSRDTFRQNSPKTARNQQTRRMPSLSAALNFSRATILRPAQPSFPENLPLKPTAMRKAISAARQDLPRNAFNTAHPVTPIKPLKVTYFYKQTISLFPAMLYTRHLSGSLQETPPSCTRAIRAHWQKTSAAHGFALTKKAFSFYRPHKHISHASARKHYDKALQTVLSGAYILRA